jgi:hypothetical protein
LGATGDENVGTFVDETLGRGQAYAAITASNECYFAVKLLHDFSDSVCTAKK